jgi:predicted nucleic acid-binding protein
VVSLVDSNVLVYRFDPRDPVKQRIAEELLRAGVVGGTLVLAHQSLIEFFAAVTRPRPDLGSAPLLPADQARTETESLMAQFRVLYPNRDVLQTALHATATYGFSWFDAHMWAHAEVFGLSELLSEDFTHGRHYGTVRVANPFAATTDGVHELPPLYA